MAGFDINDYESGDYEDDDDDEFDEDDDDDEYDDDEDEDDDEFDEDDDEDEDEDDEEDSEEDSDDEINNTLFLTNLPDNITYKEISALTYGVNTVRINGQNGAKSAYIEFYNKKIADINFKRLQNKVIRGSTISVVKKTKDLKCLLVRHFNKNYTKSELYDIFNRAARSAVRINLKMNRDMAFLSCSSTTDAAFCRNKLINNYQMNVSYAFLQ